MAIMALYSVYIHIIAAQRFGGGEFCSQGKGPLELP